MNQSTHPTEKISVVIPVYNGNETLRDTLQSVLNQTYSHMEIIVIDDGSEISPESIINQIADDRIRLCRIVHANANIARNYGISKCTGNYIAMLDADDRWLENHLEVCLNTLKKLSADGLYGSLFLTNKKDALIDTNNVFYARELAYGESMIDYLLTTGFGAQTSTLFTTTDSARDIMWAGSLIDHQDYDFVVRFNKKYKLVPKTEPTTIYYLASGRKSHFESCIDFVEKNRADVNPKIYNRYNLGMLLRAVDMEAPDEIIQYFREEATRYREYLSYQEYISICEADNTLQEWIDKIKYIYSILRIKTDR